MVKVSKCSGAFNEEVRGAVAFDQWMRNVVKSVYYSDNNRMMQAYEIVDRNVMNTNGN